MGEVILLASALVAQVATAQGPESQSEQTAVEIPVMSDAYSAAAQDILQMPDSSRVHQRYVWVPPWMQQQYGQFVAEAANLGIQLALNRDTTLSFPTVLSAPNNGRMGVVLRYDMLTLASEESSYKQITQLWESLGLVEPYAHIPQLETKSTTAILSPAIDSDAAAILARETGSQAPVMRADWLLTQLLTTVDGGRYYDAIGLDIEKPAREFLLAQGIDEQRSKKLSGDQRVLMLRSGVTGKKRRIDRLQGVVARRNSNTCWITRDVSDSSVKVVQQVDYNLLAFSSDAAEIIYERRDGLHGYLLSDGQLDEVQRSVPDDIAVDHSLPSVEAGGGGTRRLQPAISCIRCHWPSDGLLDVRNDVEGLLAASGADVLAASRNKGDLASARALERIAGLYADTGGFQRRLLTGRLDLDRSVQTATRRGLSVPESGQIIGSIYADYRYRVVSPERAALELGWSLGGHTDQTAGRWLAERLVGRTTGDEDVSIVVLAAGMALHRADWERIYADASARVRTGEPLPNVVEPANDTDSGAAPLPQQPGDDAKRRIRR